MTLGRIRNHMRDLISDERGVSAIEYGIIAGGLSIVIAAVVYQIGVTLDNDFHDVNDGFN